MKEKDDESTTEILKVCMLCDYHVTRVGCHISYGYDHITCMF